MLIGDLWIDVNYRRSDKARRLRLRVSEGQVEVVMPRRANLKMAEALVAENRDWIARHVLRQRTAQSAGQDGAILLYGDWHRVVRTEGGSVSVDASSRLVAVPGSHGMADVEAHLKTLARFAVETAVRSRSQEMGLVPRSVQIRDQRTKWGACTSRGTVTFNWKLVMAPPAVLDYVVVHELAHLREMNHSKRFWDLVARHCPEFARHRDWLRRNGQALRLLESLPELTN